VRAAAREQQVRFPELARFAHIDQGDFACAVQQGFQLPRGDGIHC
jgi:hypothetical protein